MTAPTHTAYLDCQIDAARGLVAANGFALTGLLSALRFSNVELGSLSKAMAVVAVGFLLWGLCCATLLTGRIRAVKREALREVLVGKIGAPRSVEPRNVFERMPRPDRGGPFRSGRLLEWSFGVYAPIVEVNALTLAEFEREVEGGKTRALSGLVFGAMAAMFVATRFTFEWLA